MNNNQFISADPTH